MTTRINIFAINGAETEFRSHYSGYIGIAPYSLETKNDGEISQYVNDPNYNFMYQLKLRKKIKHQVVAFFSSADRTIKTSSVKFGGWDQNAIAEGDRL